MFYKAQLPYMVPFIWETKTSVLLVKSFLISVTCKIISNGVTRCCWIYSSLLSNIVSSFQADFPLCFNVLRHSAVV